MTIEPERVPPRAPQRWFAHIDYGNGFRIELPQPSETAAVRLAVSHVEHGHSGTVKVGYYGFRSRVIAYSGEQLLALLKQGEL